MRIVLSLLVALTGCAVTEPSSVGTISGRCRIEPTSEVTVIDLCPSGQTMVCLPGTDAGEGLSWGRCCPTGSDDHTCPGGDGGVVNQ